MLSFFQLIIKKCLKQQILKDQFIVVVNMGLFFGGNCSSDYELWFYESDNCGFTNNKIYPDKECTQGLNTFGLDELEVFQVLNYE